MVASGKNKGKKKKQPEKELEQGRRGECVQIMLAGF